MKIPRRRYCQRDIDRLLSGGSPEDESLARLVPLAQVLRRAGRRIPPEVEVDRFAAEAARLVPGGPRPAPSGGRCAGSVSKRRGLRVNPKLAGAVAALVLMFSATAGIAYAADGAVPGDTLYGLDLALEDIGVGNGGFEERLTEASTLVERGQVEQGLTCAAEALAKDGADGEDTRAAADALLDAADAVAGNENAQSADVRAQVAEKLRFMATTELTGQELGQAVSDLARGISLGGLDGEDADPSEDEDGTTTDTQKGKSTENTGKANGHSNTGKANGHSK